MKNTSMSLTGTLDKKASEEASTASTGTNVNMDKADKRDDIAFTLGVCTEQEYKDYIASFPKDDVYTPFATAFHTIVVNTLFNSDPPPKKAEGTGNFLKPYLEIFKLPNAYMFPIRDSIGFTQTMVLTTTFSLPELQKLASGASVPNPLPSDSADMNTAYSQREKALAISTVTNPEVYFFAIMAATKYPIPLRTNKQVNTSTISANITDMAKPTTTNTEGVMKR